MWRGKVATRLCGVPVEREVFAASREVAQKLPVRQYTYMRRIVFYSWQSDLPNATNRGFIQRALESAATAIAGDDTVAVEPVIDRDTEGVAGSPDIASTIFAKIAAADVVIVDVSIINRATGGRPSPNPNVLIELGYALRALGYERVILVFNRAYGAIEDLPFDLRTRRILSYEVAADAAGKPGIRSDLSKRLDTAIRAALAQVPQVEDEPAVLAAVAAIEAGQGNRMLVLRRNLTSILQQLDRLNPTKASAGGTVEELEKALDESQEAVAEFSKIAEAIATMNDTDAALEVYRWFGNLFERYHLPEGFNGAYSEADFDFFRFVGHELVVTLFACLLRERKWELIGHLLQEPVPTRYKRREGGPGNEDWSYASRYVGQLGGAGQQRGRLSLHADLLHHRHTTGGLAAIVSEEDFIAADFFLFLRSELPPNERGPHLFWHAWSVLYMKSAPRFLLDAERQARAEELGRALGVPSMDEFKRRLEERGPELRRLFDRGWWNYPISSKDVQRIGSR